MNLTFTFYLLLLETSATEYINCDAVVFSAFAVPCKISLAAEMFL